MCENTTLVKNTFVGYVTMNRVSIFSALKYQRVNFWIEDLEGIYYPVPEELDKFKDSSLALVLILEEICAWRSINLDWKSIRSILPQMGDMILKIVDNEFMCKTHWDKSAH
jgi:hypothetical protein